MYKNGKQKDLKNAKTSQKFAIFPFPLMQYMSKEGHFFIFQPGKRGEKMVIFMKGNRKVANIHDHFVPLFLGENKNGPLCSFIVSEEKGIEN